MSDEPSPDFADCEDLSPAPAAHKPELLSPAGDEACLDAAVASGADAVYFGLSVGFNARARAANFTPETLPAIVARLHRAGVKGYLTLNTLVFSDELAAFEETVRAVAASGLDAVLVQDLGAARLIRAIAPDLPLHASTQMTLTSAESIRAAQTLGLSRVVLARELSLDEIRRIRRETTVGLEVFVHGALCISYSGQCLASLSFGGRSANRGQCAQACRLPYELRGNSGALENDRRYPLSPNDLAALDLIPQLVAAGVDAVKIEGRLKSADYVAAVTAAYRRAIDEAVKKTEDTRQKTEGRGLVHFSAKKAANQSRPSAENMDLTPSDLAALQTTFSRGFCHGWLDGDRPRELVTGRSPAHRGVLLGTVENVSKDRVAVRLVADVRRGDGVALVDADTPDQRQGGRVYEIFSQHGEMLKQAETGMKVEITFGRDAIDLARVTRGQTLYKTDDSRGVASPAEAAAIRIPIDMTVVAAVGEALRVRSTLAGATCEVATESPLARATKHAITEATLREQLGRLGGTPFELRELHITLTGAPMVPLSVLNQLRRELVAKLEEAIRPRPWTVTASPALPRLRPEPIGEGIRLPQMLVLCRTLDQLSAALESGASHVIADMSGTDDNHRAVDLARAHNAKIELAAPRIQKPGEESLFPELAACMPDGVLARNLATLAFFAQRGIPVSADYSLNAANELSGAWLLEKGAGRVAAALDLNRPRLQAMLAHVPADRVEVVAHLHVPMFHSAHCLYCTSSDGQPCGRPCRRQRLALRDRKGVEHPVAVDVFCRNTVFQAAPQSAAEVVPGLLRRGVGFFRIELPPHAAPGEVPPLLSLYRRLLAGEITGVAAWKELQRACPLGLTRGMWK